MKFRVRASSGKRIKKGVCITEAVIMALAVLFPVLFLGMDLTVIVLSNSINEHVAKDAARAAASHVNEDDAKAAAKYRISTVKRSELVPNITMTKFNYVSERSVNVQTTIDVRMPAPFPFFHETKLVAQATAPIVATPADL